ncbi:MAG: carbohydrate ABC transporter permease [Pleurocapsa sp. SU_196_0]|nr:carbohydrate ABC transporter permease [Pleurocapsa sp. SU_196_0]
MNTTAAHNDLEMARAMRMRKRQRQLVSNIVVYTILLVIAVISVYPFLWTIRTSFTTEGGLFEFPPSLLPNKPDLRNFVDVFSLVPIARQILNSVIICFFGVTLSVLFSTLGAYPLAKMRFPGRDAIFFAILATLVLPNEAGLIVNFVTTKTLGLLQSDAGKYAAVIIPALGNVAGLFLMRQAYLSIPAELLEAARMDGASELGIWWRIMLPLTLPTIAAFSILQFVAFWNTFLWPIIVIGSDRQLYPLSAGLLDLSGSFASNTRAVSAGAVIATIPIILVFLFFQRYFLRGLEGAVKG